MKLTYFEITEPFVINLRININNVHHVEFCKYTPKQIDLTVYSVLHVTDTFIYRNIYISFPNI